jgi:gas vesicle protein
MEKKAFFKGALIGALLGSVAALLATNKTGAERRKEIKALSTNLFGKIVKEAERIGELSQDKYEMVVEKVVKEYGKKKKLAKATLDDLSDELKEKWGEIKKHLE